MEFGNMQTPAMIRSPWPSLTRMVGLGISGAIIASCIGGGPGAVGGSAQVGKGSRIDNGAVGQPPSNGKTLLAIYMLGSDLEDDMAPRDKVADEQALGGPS